MGAEVFAHLRASELTIMLSTVFKCVPWPRRLSL